MKPGSLRMRRESPDGSVITEETWGKLDAPGPAEFSPESVGKPAMVSCVIESGLCPPCVKEERGDQS